MAITQDRIGGGDEILRTGSADALLLQLPTMTPTGIAAAILDDLIIDWLHWDEAMQGPPPVSPQPLGSRIQALRRQGRLDPTTEEYERFVAWSRTPVVPASQT